MRKYLLTGVFVLAACVAAVALANSTDIPETVTIDDCAKTKTAVEFPHKAHFELVKTCTECHHTTEGLTLENAGEMKVETCASCHVEPEKAETPACAEKSLKKNPYHISCVGCHKAAKKENAETKAPSKCTACHPKAKA